MDRNIDKGMGPSQKFRRLKGVSSVCARLSLIMIPIVGTAYVCRLPEYFNLAIYKEQYLGVFLTFLLVSTFFTLPATKTASRDFLPWYDICLVILSFLAGGYVAIFYPQVVPTMGFPSMTRMVLGGIAIGLLLEAARRLIGWPIVIVSGIFVFYAAYAHFLPGILTSRNIPWGRVLTYLYLSPNAILGIPLAIAGTVVFAFIFFGRILFSVGGGRILSDFALALMGRYRGGPAKVAVLASSLFGTLSGSAVANVAMIGVVTIPLMKRSGYRPHMAGAIEAVASTGGLIMPPIMAATAFIMAEFLGIPYPEIALSAAIPAALYYIAVFTQIHLEAVKEGLEGLPAEDLPTFSQAIKQGWIFLIPAAVLVYSLFVLYIPPELSALFAVVATVLVGLFRKEVRWILTHKAWTILEEAGRGLLEAGIICAIAGIVIGAVTLTGIGLTLSNMLVRLSGGNVLVMLLLAAVGAIILGMGMPVTATYVTLVVLAAPALIQLGIKPLAAHLFIMYFGVMSFLTPPVAIAAYVAAGIAGSGPMRTGLAGVRLGIIAYVVPFAFALSPSLLLMGPVIDILFHVSTALGGTLVLAVSFEGYLFARLSMPKRVCLAIGALGLISPEPIGTVIGIVLVLPLLMWEWRKKKGISSHFSVKGGPSKDLETEVARR